MSRQSRKNARPERAVGRPSGLRTGLLALTGVGLAVAGATWMTLGARSSAAPSAQTPPQAASTMAATPATTQPQPTATQPAAAPGTSEGAAATAQTKTASTQPATASAPAAPAPTPGSGSAGQQAFIDPATGKLRPAEHDDAAALNASRNGARRLARTAQAAAEPQEFATEGGAMGIAVPDEVLPYTVATKTPDGRVVIEHVTGGKAAVKKVRENTKNGGMVQRKGEPNDR